MHNAAKMLESLLALAIEIAMLDENNKDNTSKLRELLAKAYHILPESQEVIYQLESGFRPILDNVKDFDPLADWANLIFEPTITIGNYILDDLNANKKEDIATLQWSLLAIQNLVKNRYYHVFMKILRDASHVLTLIEEKALDKGMNSLELEKDILSAIKKKSIKDSSIFKDMSKYEQDEIIKIEKSIDSDRKAIQKYLCTAQELKKKYVPRNAHDTIKKDRRPLENIGKLDEPIPIDARIETYKYYLTRDGIKEFASWCDDES